MNNLSILMSEGDVIGLTIILLAFLAFLVWDSANGHKHDKGG